MDSKIPQFQYYLKAFSAAYFWNTYSIIRCSAFIFHFFIFFIIFILKCASCTQLPSSLLKSFWLLNNFIIWTKWYLAVDTCMDMILYDSVNSLVCALKLWLWLWLQHNLPALCTQHGTVCACIRWSSFHWRFTSIHGLTRTSLLAAHYSTFTLSFVVSYSTWFATLYVVSITLEIFWRAKLCFIWISMELRHNQWKLRKNKKEILLMNW